MKLCHVALVLIATLLGAGAILAAPATTQPSGRLVVGVLPFDSQATATPDLGRQVTEMLTSVLAETDKFKLVDRASLSQTLEEQELSATGMVSPEQAIKIGRLVGAEVLVIGKAFTMDKNLVITAKVIGTQTTLVDSVMVRGDRSIETAKLVEELGAKLASSIATSGAALTAVKGEKDPLPGLKAKLQGKKLPTIVVHVKERHVGPSSAQFDPAAETEIISVLQQAGLTVLEAPDGKPETSTADVVFSGEAFSEFAARVKSIISCTASVEFRSVNKADGRIIIADRTTARAADLSEQIAGKAALKVAARKAAIAYLQTLTK